MTKIGAFDSVLTVITSFSSIMNKNVDLILRLFIILVKNVPYCKRNWFIVAWEWWQITIIHDFQRKTRNGYKYMYNGNTNMQDCFTITVQIRDAHLKRLLPHDCSELFKNICDCSQTTKILQGSWGIITNSSTTLLIRVHKDSIPFVDLWGIVVRTMTV